MPVKGTAESKSELLVAEQALAATYQHEQTTTSMVILGVHFAMLSEVDNTVGEESDLNFRGTGIVLVSAVLGYNFLLVFHG